MALDESIKYYEEKATELEELINKIGISSYDEINYEEHAKEYRQIVEWLRELEMYRNMDKREYYKVYTDKTMEYGYGEFDSVDRARASIVNGVIVRVVELKEIVDEI